MENLELYEKVRSVPENAKKTISAGRTKGMTDINPMWRIKTLTEQFGPCGIGWYYIPVRKWPEVYGNEVAAFVDIEMYVKIDGEWSKPIYGTGGSKFAAQEKNGVYISDECYKMATTDAISVACKQLGIGADVYWAADRTKYDGQGANAPDVLTEAQVNTIFMELKRTGVGLKSVLKQYNLSDIHEMTIVQFKEAMEVLKKKPNKESVTTPPEDLGEGGLPWNNPEV